MAKLIRFLDEGPKGVWSNIRMANNDPCWIGVADSGVLVKKSRVGIFGKKIYKKRILDSTNAASALSNRFQDDLTPKEMRHPLLKAFTNAVLHCNSLSEVESILGEEFPEPDLAALAAFLARRTN